MYIKSIVVSLQCKQKQIDMKNLEQYNEMMSKIGTEVNELEYIDHVVIENSKYYFVIIHLNGKERLEEVV